MEKESNTSDKWENIPHSSFLHCFKPETRNQHKETNEDVSISNYVEDYKQSLSSVVKQHLDMPKLDLYIKQTLMHP